MEIIEVDGRKYQIIERTSLVLDTSGSIPIYRGGIGVIPLDTGAIVGSPSAIGIRGDIPKEWHD